MVQSIALFASWKNTSLHFPSCRQVIVSVSSQERNILTSIMPIFTTGRVRRWTKF
jgi:hypothetical protein